MGADQPRHDYDDHDYDYDDGTTGDDDDYDDHDFHYDDGTARDYYIHDYYGAVDDYDCGGSGEAVGVVRGGRQRFDCFVVV